MSLGMFGPRSSRVITGISAAVPVVSAVKSDEFLPSTGEILGGGGLHAAVIQVDIAAVTNILNMDPTAVNEKGWSGQVALHVACLRGDLVMIDLLLEHGADTNAPNNAGETPTHFACRRGNPRILHVLRQHGGLVDLTDNLGRNGMHHATQGGCVFMMKYLGEIGNLDYSVVDNALQTPLHIACGHLHKDAITFLLKDKRSDPGRSDRYGQTALHVAAAKGDGEVLWSLLMNSNCGQLEVKDRNGDTPTSLANKGQGRRYVDLNKFLGRLKCEPPRSVPTGPVILWYYLLLMPIVFPILYILAANYLSCLMAYFAAVWNTVYIWRSPPRVVHYCRWPTPLYLGAFISGYVHTVAFGLYGIIPVLYPSIPMLLVFLLCVCTTVCLFNTIMRQDPGTVRNSEKGLGILNIADGTMSSTQYCTFCEIVTPRRAKHCRLCGVCQRNLDHHCLYLLHCIADNNHRTFLLFSSLIAVQQIAFLTYCCVLVYTTRVITMATGTTVGVAEVVGVLADTLRGDYCMVILFVYNLATVLWMIPYLFVQLTHVSLGETMFFQHELGPRRQLSVKQRISNLLNFFMDRRFNHSTTYEHI